MDLLSDSCSLCRSLQTSTTSGVLSSRDRSNMSSMKTRSSSNVAWPRIRLTICTALILSLSRMVETRRSSSLPFSSRLSNFRFNTCFRRWSLVSSMVQSMPVLLQFSHGGKPEHYKCCSPQLLRCWGFFLRGRYLPSIFAFCNYCRPSEHSFF